MLIFGDRLMREAQVMISQGALKPYPTKIFELADLQAVFTELNGPKPPVAVINIDSRHSKRTIPVSTPLKAASHGRAPILTDM